MSLNKILAYISKTFNLPVVLVNSFDSEHQTVIELDETNFRKFIYKWNIDYLVIEKKTIECKKDVIEFFTFWIYQGQIFVFFVKLRVKEK